MRQVYVSDFENKSYSSAKKSWNLKDLKVQATQENDDKVKKEILYLNHLKINL